MNVLYLQKKPLLTKACRVRYPFGIEEERKEVGDFALGKKGGRETLPLRKGRETQDGREGPLL